MSPMWTARGRDVPGGEGAPRRWSPEIAATLMVIAVGAAEMAVLRLAPPDRRPVISAGLLGGALAALVLFAVLWHRRHTPAREVHHPALPEAGSDGWFGADALEGFPMEELRPLLRAPDAPDLNQLYTAWVLVHHGHDAPWISHHLDLPPAAVHLLVDAAQQRQ
ncbi:hypothetical protein [Streptomyces sp. YGL11-2]|uniref:hypothetical protein n=1 Tax=Streptomyces sp. YGL11-2 TaxID=3414028 RepID=UPI003CF789E4